MTAEDEEFNRIERESTIRQEYIRDMTKKSIGQSIPMRDSTGQTLTPQERIARLTAEIAVLTELVRVLSNRVRELENQTT
jgi:ubiquinone biosynthesis protein UbiJ